MKEYIMQFGEALYDEKSGEAVFKPVVKGEVIRCKDCKHWNALIPSAEHGFCDAWREVFMTTEREGFCYKAERKEE